MSATFLDPPIPAKLADGPPYYLVRVSGLYLTRTGGLIGNPLLAMVWADKKPAMERAREVRKRKLWAGRVRVVKRMHLRPPQW